MNVVRVFLHNLRLGAGRGRASRTHRPASWPWPTSTTSRRCSCSSTPAGTTTQAGQAAGAEAGRAQLGLDARAGPERLFDSRTWSGLQRPTRRTCVGSFGHDPRVLAWDLFNEPSNSGYMDAVVPLLKAVFAWAREADPDQPLTSGLWNDHPMSNDVMLANSDVVTFHDYDPPDKLEAHIQKLGDGPPADLHRVHGAHARQPVRDVPCRSSSATTSARSTGVSSTARRTRSSRGTRRCRTRTSRRSGSTTSSGPTARRSVRRKWSSSERSPGTARRGSAREDSWWTGSRVRRPASPSCGP